MEKFRELKNNEKFWSWEDAIRRGEAAYQMNLQERIKESREKGLQEGLQEGVQKGLQEGVQKGLQEGLQEGSLKGKANLLFTQVKTKYHVCDTTWIQSLNVNQLESAALLILSCDTFEQLKQALLASK